MRSKRFRSTMHERTPSDTPNLSSRAATADHQGQPATDARRISWGQRLASSPGLLQRLATALGRSKFEFTDRLGAQCKAMHCDPQASFVAVRWTPGSGHSTIHPGHDTRLDRRAQVFTVAARHAAQVQRGTVHAGMRQQAPHRLHCKAVKTLPRRPPGSPWRSPRRRSSAQS